MALIDCPECGKQISDKAVSCIHCGNPLVTTPTPVKLAAESDAVVTTEATNKAWKAVQGIGVLMIVLGLVSCMGTAGSGGTGGAFALFALGAATTIVGKVGAWWSNG